MGRCQAPRGAPSTHGLVPGTPNIHGMVLGTPGYLEHPRMVMDPSHPQRKTLPEAGEASGNLIPLSANEPTPPRPRHEPSPALPITEPALLEPWFS